MAAVSAAACAWKTKTRHLSNVTDIGCKLLDNNTCQCKHYATRKKYVPDCVQLTPDNVQTLSWIPHTCAYRLINEGKDLPDWHHLISGSRNTIHDAGMSVISQTVSEEKVPASGAFAAHSNMARRTRCDARGVIK